MIAFFSARIESNQHSTSLTRIVRTAVISPFVAHASRSEYGPYIMHECIFWQSGPDTDNNGRQWEAIGVNPAKAGGLYLDTVRLLTRENKKTASET